MNKEEWLKVGYVSEPVDKALNLGCSLADSYPDTDMLVHLEYKGAEAKSTDKVVSTSGLLKNAVNSLKKDFIVVT